MKRFYIQTRKYALSLLDLLTRKKGVAILFNGLRLRVPGKFYRYYAADYEKNNFLFLKENIRPGATCLDIGAHIGIYTVCMAKLGAGKIYSFEPTPSSFAVLRKMVALNHCEKQVTSLPDAVAWKTGRTSFYLNHALYRGSEKVKISEANSLVNVYFGKKIGKEELEVTTVSIDDLVQQQNLEIDFIKIDVEGAEADVLKGAERTMLKDRPSGIISVHNFAFKDKEQSLAGIWQTLLDYRMVALLNDQLLSRDWFFSMASTDIFDFHFKPQPGGPGIL
ncbi:MAG: FkbM family methyltransferase [Chitinophagaceae bacterium]